MGLKTIEKDNIIQQRLDQLAHYVSVLHMGLDLGMGLAPAGEIREIIEEAFALGFLSSTRSRVLDICKNPNCKKLFLVDHGKKFYCSIDCSNWSQSQLKKRWHADQRAKRENNR